jgi:short-subunit dehydrogenase
VRLDGKRVILTGASAGIGRSLAAALARRGAALTLAARDRARLDAVVEEISEAYPESRPAVAAPCDVSNELGVRDLIGGVVERAGGVDVLINNAGISVFGEERRTSTDDYRRLMSVNFFGALFAMREALPFMRRQESGLVVNVASVAALHGVPYLAAYCASKAALVAVSQALRSELAGSGVRIMIAYPGYTATEIYEREKKAGGARRPTGRYASPETVAEAIARGIERGTRDLYLTWQGRALGLLRGLAPFVVERAMRDIARDLADPDARASGDSLIPGAGDGGVP